MGVGDHESPVRQALKELGEVMLDHGFGLLVLGGQARDGLARRRRLGARLEHSHRHRVEPVVVPGLQVQEHRLLLERARDDMVGDLEPAVENRRGARIHRGDGKAQRIRTVRFARAALWLASPG
jgi:hypothetical protein